MKFKIKLFPKTKKQKIITLIILSAVLIAAIALAFYLQKRNTQPKITESTPTASPETTETTTPPPPVYTCPLDGTTQTTKPRRPIAVMIDNHTGARPHYGITSACVVIEALAEGGITRLEALYSCQFPDTVGPVRSARPYFIEFAKGFNGLYAYCGGSPEALRMVRGTEMDLDQMKYPAPYWRTSSKRRPHNLLTSIEKLYEQADKKGAETSFTGNSFFSFKKDALPQNRGNIKNITINFSSYSYRVSYEYESSTNSYLRYLAGKAYRDAKTGTQIAAKNIVIILTTSYVTDSKGRLVMKTTGSGNAIIFQDGKEIKGTWKRKNGKPWVLADDKGNIISLNRGQTWFEVIKPSITVNTGS